MLFWLSLILTIVGIISVILYEYVLYFKHNLTENLYCAINGVLTGIGIASVIFSLIIFSLNYIGLEGKIAEYKEHYNTMVFEMENNLYKNDITMTSQRELVKEIQKWNENLAQKKKDQYDPWIGIYIPDIYDDFEFIPLEKILKEDDIKNEIIQMR